MLFSYIWSIACNGFNDLRRNNISSLRFVLGTCLEELQLGFLTAHAHSKAFSVEKKSVTFFDWDAVVCSNHIQSMLIMRLNLLMLIRLDFECKHKHRSHNLTEEGNEKYISKETPNCFSQESAF